MNKNKEQGNSRDNPKLLLESIDNRENSCKNYQGKNRVSQIDKIENEKRDILHIL